MYNDQAKRFGLLHWHLLRSAAEEEAREPDFNPDGASINIAELLAGVISSGYRAPEISWWVHTRENDPAELLRRVTVVLDPAKRIEKAAEKQRDRIITPPHDLHDLANTFSRNHHKDIDVLAEFVTWLASRDVLAPGILFRGAAWSDSRRAQRIVEVPQALTDRAIEHCCDVVFGLFIDGAETSEHVRSEMREDIYERGWEDDDEPQVDEVEASSRTLKRVCKEFWYYCYSLRLSLLALRNEVLRVVPPKELLHSQHFWRTFIDAARKAVTRNKCCK